MNDANRSRFSVRQPPTENIPNSPGPAAYTPRDACRFPYVKGNVTMHDLRGPSERDRILSDGKTVAHISPIGPGDYIPVHMDPPATPEGAPPPPRPSTSPRVGGLMFGATAMTAAFLDRERREKPGPGEYAPSPPKIPGVGAVVPFERRHANEPVVRQDAPAARWCPHAPRGGILPSPLAGNLTPLNYSRGSGGSPPHAGSSARGTSQSGGDWHRAGTSPGPSRASPSPTNTPGRTISQSSRYFNINNINSRGPRDHDPDFANPPPGAYDARTRNVALPAGGRFSSTPRNMDPPNNNVPGPGSYTLQ